MEERKGGEEGEGRGQRRAEKRREEVEYLNDFFHLYSSLIAANVSAQVIALSGACISMIFTCTTILIKRRDEKRSGEKKRGERNTLFVLSSYHILRCMCTS